MERKLLLQKEVFNSQGENVQFQELPNIQEISKSRKVTRKNGVLLIGSDFEFLNEGEVLIISFGIVDHQDGQRAAGALCDIEPTFDFIEGDLEAVSAGAWVVEDEVIGVEVQIFDFDFIVHFCCHGLVVVRLLLL
jgi:uncharacterized protein YrzB (UPF0473 family)